MFISLQDYMQSLGIHLVLYLDPTISWPLVLYFLQTLRINLVKTLRCEKALCIANFPGDQWTSSCVVATHLILKIFCLLLPMT